MKVVKHPSNGIVSIDCETQKELVALRCFAWLYSKSTVSLEPYHDVAKDLRSKTSGVYVGTKKKTG